MMCAGASFGIGKTGTIERNKQKRQDCKINATLQKIKCGKHSASNLDGDSFKFGLSSQELRTTPLPKSSLRDGNGPSAPRGATAVSIKTEGPERSVLALPP
eukprot:jgi/Undpi1/5732/HiC_scaffold_2.g01006.m1